ncbi:MAG TPA: phage holin family protein [Myxococcales bacterium]|jgi:putative membrane protein
MALLLSWMVLTVAVLVAAAVVPGFKVRGAGGALIAAAIFGVLNWLVGWIIFVALGIATLGLGFLLAFLTRWVVSAIVLKMTSGLTDKLTIRGFGSALVAALVMSGVGTLGEYLLRRL